MPKAIGNRNRTPVATEMRHTYVMVLSRVDFYDGIAPRISESRESRWSASVYDQDTPDAYPGRLISMRGEQDSAEAARRDAMRWMEILLGGASWEGAR